MSKTFTIGQAAKAAGVAPRTIRYYESAGVLASPRRTASGYRLYGEREVERLLFVRRARALRFPLREIRALIATLEGRANGAVRPRLLALVREQQSVVRRQIEELKLLHAQLQQVVRRRPRLSPDNQTCRCLNPPKANQNGLDRRRTGSRSRRVANR